MNKIHEHAAVTEHNLKKTLRKWKGVIHRKNDSKKKNYIKM